MTTQTTADHPPCALKLRRALESALRDAPGSLKAEVAAEALDADDAAVFFHDLANFGCVSGMVGKLVWYTDTHAFFDAHYDEIEELRQETEASLGEPIRVRGDLKNFFAWFAFEETAWRMADDDLGLAA